MQSTQVKSDISWLIIESKNGNQRKERKSQCAGFNIIYKYTINKHIGRGGEVRVLMNTLNSSLLIVYLKK